MKDQNKSYLVVKNIILFHLLICILQMGNQDCVQSDAAY